MVNSIWFDAIVNSFQDLVTEVFSGTNEKQKAKLREILNHFTKISCSESTSNPEAAVDSLQVKEKAPLSVIHNKLPPEMVENIFKFLNYKDICQAQQICRRWKEIIDNGNLVSKASSKTKNSS